MRAGRFGIVVVALVVAGCGGARGPSQSDGATTDADAAQGDVASFDVFDGGTKVDSSGSELGQGVEAGIDVGVDARDLAPPPDAAPDRTPDAATDRAPMADVASDRTADVTPAIDASSGDGGASACTPLVGAGVAAHVTAMSTQGWAATNRAGGLTMFGCAGAATTRACLGALPRASTTAYGAGWEADHPGSVLRILRTDGTSSESWTRSSADGRFVGSGRASAGQILDLTDGHVVKTPEALGFPGFFPDASGWQFGGPSALYCRQAVLVSGVTYASMYAPDCTTINTGYAASVGAVPGGEYWALGSQFFMDDGGHVATLADPSMAFTSLAQVRLYPIADTGTKFAPKAAYASVPLAGEGDAVLSPSASLMVTRVAQGGYRLRKVVAAPSGATYTVDLPELARYCVSGGTPSISYDERWMVMHHYVGDADATALGFTGPTDPAFAAYRAQGAANVYLVDLTTGARTRVTRMAPGQYALYPHFRSDGWIYFVVRVAGTSTEYLVASDAALN
jgi:hypothetical protein